MKILIVDDKEENLYMLESLLKGSGHEVVSALDGIEALEKLKKDSIDMIISDILMPKMDGFQLCRECKSDDSLKKIPFIFYTATYTDKKDEKFALSLGAEKFIVKPMEPNFFMEIIENVIKDYKKGTLTFSEITIEKEETVYLKEYSERLVKKLESKMLNLEKSNLALGERVKELNCLYKIAEIVGKPGISMEEILQETAESIPACWQYPEITCARIILEGQEFRTKNFRETAWKQTGDIFVHKKQTGAIEVYCLEEKPESDEGPFLKEERKLISAIAKRLGQITERHRAEDEIKRAAKEWRITFDSITDSVFIIDKDYKLVRMNKAFADVFKMKPVELIGRPCYEIVHGTNEPVPNCPYKKTLKTKKPATSELFEPQLGIYLEVMSSPIFDDKGEVRASVHLIKDITERKKAEEALQKAHNELEERVKERTKELNRALYDTQEARDRIDGILKSVGDGLIVTDIYNRVILMNRAAENLLDVRFSELIEQPIDFAIQDDTLRDQLKATLDKKETDGQFDFKLPGEDTEHPRIMCARTSVIKDRTSEQTTSIITIIHDVTHEREVELMKTEFLSTAAHELRTPLTSIQGFSEILITRKDLSKEERRKFLSYINKQASGLAMIVNDLLDVSRIESELGFALNKQKCIAGDVIKDVIPYFQESSPKLKIEVVLPDKPVELFVDKEKMQQVLKNILSNAIKYSPEDSVIRVVGEIVPNLELVDNERSSAFRISIEDRGIGMTPGQVEQIFNKFYRVDVSDSAPEGTGLGMTIVRYIVEMHDGKVWVESEPGKGTTVKFVIPI